MASLTIRNIDDSLKANLRMIAAENGRSMEEEVRQVLKHFLLTKRRSMGIGTRISNRFKAVGGIDLPEVPRSVPCRLTVDINSAKNRYLRSSFFVRR